MNFDIYDAARGGVVIKNIHVAASFFERFAGLMFRKDPEPYSGLVFYHAGGIHTCFMRFALDIVFIDRNMKVLKLFRKVGPFRLVFCCNSYAAIEFKSGMSGVINAGDILEFKNG